MFRRVSFRLLIWVGCASVVLAASCNRETASSGNRPRIALVRGSSDRIEDILGKLGVGTLAGNSFSNPQGEKGPEISLYDYTGTGTTSATGLLGNLAEMRKYHIIFLPCST